MTLANQTVWIAVLHYLGIEHTRQCLASLKHINYQPLEILVIVNGSPDGSGPELEQEFPGIHLLRLEENRGFAGGSNAGIRYCMERGAQWVWLLNNDTQIEPDALEILMREAAANPDAACLGATITLPGPNGPVKAGAPSINYWKGKTYERGEVTGKRPISCPWLSGSNLLFRTAAFGAVDGFDEQFFLYYEDTDICHRLIDAGWKCLLVPEANIHHIGNASTAGRLAVWRHYYGTRNRLLFFSKIRKGALSLPIIADVGLNVARHMLTLPSKGEDGKRQLRAEVMAWNDFFAGRFGKCNSLDF